MSYRQMGNRRENECGKRIEATGLYDVIYTRGSRGHFDILAVAKDDTSVPHLMVAVIRPSHGRVGLAFDKLRDGVQIAGAVGVVARQLKDKSWKWYWDEEYWLADVSEAVSAIKAC